MEYVIGLLVFVLGTVTGSFLNVLIYRIPLELSIVQPASFCPLCQKNIHWYDNIPLLSFLMLEGKCRHCAGVISPRYFIVELMTGLLWFGAWLFYGVSGFFAAGVILLSFLLALSVIDLERGILPDKLTVTGMIFGLGLSGFYPLLFKETLWYQGIFQSFLGLAVGALILLATAYLGKKIFKKESMGEGDIKLLAMAGAFLGWQKIILVFFLAAFLALPFALYFKYRKGREIIVYGPYLAAASALLFFMGDWMLRILLR
jgi:leader peptidase (prepilin peptidase)/N-methyltransferase